MSAKTEIKSDKILVKDIFTNMWFRIPEYQRPYVWGYEELHDLLDDLVFAMQNKPDADYFLGSIVFQTKSADPTKGRNFDENDLLDGQQRMTTLLLLLSVVRDLAEDNDAKEDCQKCIHQKSSRYRNIPERTRLVFSIRDSVQHFVDEFIKVEGNTEKVDELKSLTTNNSDVSIKNMANAILEIRNFFTKNKEIKPELFLQFILNNVLLIYVSTEDLEDAFRLFTILNNRGVPLRNSDILKSINLGEIETDYEKNKFAKFWEDAESELGDEFDRFLNHVRTVLVKDKARLNLLQEFEEKIYAPKEKEKSTGLPKQPLLKKGKNTFVFIENYLKIYKLLLGGNNHFITNSFAFDNLIKVMLTGLPATDWIPPLLRYYDKFGSNKIFDFLVSLDRKFSSDWISQYTPTYRIDAMNEIIKIIDNENSIANVFNSGCFDIDKDAFKRVVESDVYGRRFARYILLKLDYLWQNQDQRMHFETLSVEHILPQNPKSDSQWFKDFSEDERNLYTHKVGNLVLITRRKNTSQGRLDYTEKKKKYFEKNIDTCPNSLRILNNYEAWRPIDFANNQEEVLNKLYENYEIE